MTGGESACPFADAIGRKTPIAATPTASVVALRLTVGEASTPRSRGDEECRQGCDNGDRYHADRNCDGERASAAPQRFPRWLVEIECAAPVGSNDGAVDEPLPCELLLD